MGISGTLAGWIVKKGPRSNNSTSGPDFLFTQMGNDFPRFHGILRYEGSKGRVWSRKMDTRCMST